MSNRTQEAKMKSQNAYGLTETERDDLYLLELIDYHHHDGLCELDRERYIELEAKKAGA
jgi:hypothetical protein